MIWQKRCVGNPTLQLYAVHKAGTDALFWYASGGAILDVGGLELYEGVAAEGGLLGI